MTADAYRGKIIRAVLGTSPAILARVHDLSALDAICEHLVNCELAHEILRNKHYGSAGSLIHEVAAEVPEKAKGAQGGAKRANEVHDMRSSR